MAARTGASNVRIQLGVPPNGCFNVTAAGADGTVYAPSQTSSGSYYLSAYKGGNELWAAPLSTNCAYNFPASVVVGYDGNVYAAIDSQGMCSSTGRRLMGFNPTTGVVLFDVGLGNTQWLRDNGLQPYTNGLAVWWGSQVRYFDYSGSEQPSSAQVNLGSGELISYVAGGTGGKMYAMVAKWQSTTNNCQRSQVLSRIVAFDASGQLWQYNADPCQMAGPPGSTPSNGVVFGETDNSYADRFVALNGSGQVIWTYEPDSGNDGLHKFDVTGYPNQYVDNNGNVVVIRRYHNEDGQKFGAQVNVLDGSTGDRRSVIYSDELDAANSYNAVFIGTSVGRLYVVAQQCSNAWYCSSASKLYAINVAGLSLDFPRAAALGLTSQPPAAEKKYVALGDSFSSGEGVEPFNSATDVSSGPGKNLCHRSFYAYARQLDRDPAANLGLANFVACSGATTEQITGGWPTAGGTNLNEAPQYQALSADDDVVTVTIGGNDVGFSNVVAGCVVQACELQIDAAYGHITPEDVGVKLYLAYHKIREQVGPNAKVLVLGYPALVPDPSNIDQGCQWGPPMTSISPSQLTALRNLGDALNNMIKTEAEKSDIGFTYVSNHAFDGHELCTSDSYVNRVQLTGDTEYSMHPNLKGQTALGQLVVQALTN